MYSSGFNVVHGCMCFKHELLKPWDPKSPTVTALYSQHGSSRAGCDVFAFPCCSCFVFNCRSSLGPPGKPESLSNVPLPPLVLEFSQGVEVSYLQKIDLEV